MKVKLQKWAREAGISRSTAYRMFMNGTLPYPAERVSERIVLIDVPDDCDTRETVVYLRVSTRKQVDSLQHQRSRVLEYCALNGIKVDRVVEEVGSGMSENRRVLNQLLRDPKVGTIVVEHRERIARMNYGLIESALKSQSRSIVVVEDTEIEDDLVRDVTEVLTSLCARFNGKRGARARAEKIVRGITDGSPV